MSELKLLKFEPKPKQADISCVDCKFRCVSSYRHRSYCSHPKAAVHDRVHGELNPWLTNPMTLSGDNEELLEKCDAGGWFTPKPKSFWKRWFK